MYTHISKYTCTFSVLVSVCSLPELALICIFYNHFEDYHLDHIPCLPTDPATYFKVDSGVVATH